MAQTGYTPIQIYYSTTTTNAPSAGNLLSGELAINITDGKMFYKDNGGSVQVIAWKTTPTTAGGTGLTSWTAGDLPYYSTGTTLTKLGIGTNGQVLTSTGTAPQWSTLSGVAVTTFSAGTTGFTPSVATSGAITLAGTLATTNGGTGLTTFGAANRAIYSTSSSALTAGTLPTAAGGTGLTSFTANGVVYASSSSALTTGSALTFDGSRLGVNGTPSNTGIDTGDATAFVVAPNSNFGPALTLVSDSLGRGLVVSNQGKTISGVLNTGNSLVNVGSNSATDVVFVRSASEQMRLTSTGLGIGTSSPLSRLHVEGSTTGAIQLFIKNGNGSTNSSSELVFGTWSGSIPTGSGNPGPQAKIAAVSVSSLTAATDLTFWTYSSSASSAERMRLDSSGNLGLGVTPSAWGTGFQSVIETKNIGVLAAAGPYVSVMANAYYNSSNQYIYKTSAQATHYAQALGQHQWFTAGSGTAGNAISFTQAMTLDASGNLGVGTTSPGERLQVVGSGATTIEVRSAINTAAAFKLSSTGGIQAGMFMANPTVDHSLGFQTAGTERARITSGGNLLVGTTTDPGGSGIIADANGNVRAIPRSGSAKTTSYTLVKGDVGEFIEVGSGGSVTIPDSVFATGDVVSIFNNTTGNITITCSITTAYIAGTDSDKATMTLATRGVATILFISGTVCVVTGNVT